MVSRGDCKLIIYPTIGRKLLVDLREDPLEARNLADDPEHAHRIDNMMRLLADLQGETGVTLRLDE
jgi:hypothetical protein